MNKISFNILLIEDNETDVKITLRFLHKTYKNIETFVVSNGQEALDFLRFSGSFSDKETYPRPDLILLDMAMPVLDGPSFLDQFKDDESIKEIPILIFTTREKKVSAEFIEGVKGHVLKDFDGADLIHEIDKFLR